MIKYRKNSAIMDRMPICTWLPFFVLMMVPIILNAQVNTHPTKDTARNRDLQLKNIRQIARVTGSLMKDETTPYDNHTLEKYDVGGTDLGIFWQMDPTHVGIFFGDTNGKGFVAGKGGGNGGNWRSNVLAFSGDTSLDDGLRIDSMACDSMGAAREICAGGKSQPEKYQTSIPTSAVRAAGVDYVHYMNIYEWAGKNGRWLTNFSSLYASYNGGSTWVRKKEVTFKPDSRFSQICYAKRDGYVYMIGTLAGRGNPAYLARVKEAGMLQMSRYEYWNGDAKKWIKNKEEAATPIFQGPIGEASLIYHVKFKRWIMAYSYDASYEQDATLKKKMNAIVYRDAPQLNGEWSGMKMLATDQEFPGLYSPFFYPMINNRDEIYFTMSLWKPYNVFLMKADIKIL